MNRAQIMQILSGLDDEQLLQALAASGAGLVTSGMPQGGQQGDISDSAMTMGEDPILGWSALKVKRGGTDRPQLSDGNIYEELNAQKPVPGQLPYDPGERDEGYPMQGV